MSTVAHGPRPAPRPPREADPDAAPPAGLARVAARAAGGSRAAARPSAAALFVAGVGALTLLALFLRTRALGGGFWIDEGLAVGIASHPLLDVPSILRVDGSPPLYYLLLHGWMVLFGDSERATHALSVVPAVLAVPAAAWAARSLLGPRAGWIATGLAATNTFLTYYAEETRMYSLAALLGLLVAATWAHLFVRRDRRALPAFALALAALLYTHNWGLFVGAGSVAALAILAAAGQLRLDRALVRDALIAYGAVAVLYAPWLPTLAFQAAHTGAPWAERPSGHDLLSALGLVLGGSSTAIALLLVAGSGLAGALRERRREDRVEVALVAFTTTAVLGAWLASQLSPAFANRYFAVFAGPLLLLAAAGLARAGRLGLVTFALVVVFWFTPRVGALESKSNVRSVTSSMQNFVTVGDVVVTTHPEQLPVLRYYLTDGPRYANAMGFVRDPSYFDWTDALQRLRAAKPRPTIDRLLRALGRGQELVLVQPIIRTGEWGAPWTSLVRRRSAQWERLLDADRRLRREAAVPVFGFGPLPRGVRTVVYRRVG